MREHREGDWFKNHKERAEEVKCKVLIEAALKFAVSVCGMKKSSDNGIKADREVDHNIVQGQKQEN